MSKVGFVDEYLDNANKFYSLAMNQFDFYLKLMGTDCTIIRITNESKQKEVFGSTYSSDLIGDGEIVRMKYRILINMNDMRKIYQQTIDQFEVYDNRPVMHLGDIIEFSRDKKTYKFKIVEEHAFSEAADVIYRYQLQGYQEITSLS
jgi:hypothetical protein